MTHLQDNLRGENREQHHRGCDATKMGKYSSAKEIEKASHQVIEISGPPEDNSINEDSGSDNAVA